MHVISFRHEGLGNNSYLVGVGRDKAVLVDPDRSIGRYLDAANERGWRIAAVLETHVHADFVTGAVDVAEASGADVFTPVGSDVRYQNQAVGGGVRLEVGRARIECIPSPGHTPEHMSYVCRMDGQTALFSGGSIIAGGAARTDLISSNLTTELTRAQYRTLVSAFASLPAETLLYPTHGGGSFCSATGARQAASTLGAECSLNPWLNVDEQEFMRRFPESFPAAPSYFFKMRAFNQAGPRLRGSVTHPRPLNAQEFACTARDAWIIDLRPFQEFSQGHVPGSVNIRLRPSFCIWLGWLVPLEAPMLFVGSEPDVGNAVEQSMLVGQEEFRGWLQGGLSEWADAGLKVATASLLGATEAYDVQTGGDSYLDVREPEEYKEGHIPGAINRPLGSLTDLFSGLPNREGLIVYCGAGDRSATAVSLLMRLGIRHVSNLTGGIAAWRRKELPVVKE